MARKAQIEKGVSKDVKRLRGTVKADYNQIDELPLQPIDRKHIPEPPEYLSVEAKEFWFRTLDELIAVDSIKEIDLPSFQILIQSFDTIRQCQKKLATLDLLNPEYKKITDIMRIASISYSRFERAFGLSPKARIDLQKAKFKAKVDTPSTKENPFGNYA